MKEREKKPVAYTPGHSRPADTTADGADLVYSCRLLPLVQYANIYLFDGANQAIS